jgi:mono/diheme cytochrome c family protein
MPGIPDFTVAHGPLSKPDEALLESIVNGMPEGAGPTPMPPRGGDETLTDAEARLVLKYIQRAFDREE